MKNLLKRYLMAALSLFAGWLGLYLVLRTAGAYLVSSAYHEQLPIQILNRIISGRDAHPVEYYTDLLEQVFLGYSEIALLAAGVILTISASIHIVVNAGKGKELALSACTAVILLLVVEVVFRMLGITGYHLPRTREWSHALAPAGAPDPEGGH